MVWHSRLVWCRFLEGVATFCDQFTLVWLHCVSRVRTYSPTDTRFALRDEWRIKRVAASSNLSRVPPIVPAPVGSTGLASGVFWFWAVGVPTFGRFTARRRMRYRGRVDRKGIRELRMVWFELRHECVESILDLGVVLRFVVLGC